jgi:integrin beta 3
VPWTVDRIFYQSDIATHLGSTWQAVRDTAKEPGTSEDWRQIAAAGAPGLSFNIRGTYEAGESYRRLDVVTLDYGWFVAKRDDPGSVPGPGWQSGPVGRRGEKGVPGERGPAGPRGEQGKSAPHWAGVKVEGFTLKVHMSDGTVGPTINLADMFRQYEVERGE